MKYFFAFFLIQQGNSVFKKKKKLNPWGCRRIKRGGVPERFIYIHIILTDCIMIKSRASQTVVTLHLQ